jgi:hypothetical protein
MLDEFLNGIEAFANEFKRHQRLLKPLSEQPCAHRGYRFVQCMQYTASPLALPKGLNKFQITSRGRVKHHVFR